MYVYVSVCMWLCVCECEYVCMYEACDTLLHRIFWHFDIWDFDTRNGFSGREGGSWRTTEVFKKDAYRLSTSLFGHFFATHPLFSLFCTSASKYRQPVKALNENNILVSKIAPTHTRTHQTEQKMIKQLERRRYYIIKKLTAMKSLTSSIDFRNDAKAKLSNKFLNSFSKCIWT